MFLKGQQNGRPCGTPDNVKPFAKSEEPGNTLLDVQLCIEKPIVSMGLAI
jgi:hypothetical protein